MAMRELKDHELDRVCGAGWEDVAAIAGGVVAVGAGMVYTVETGGFGGFLGGGAAMASGVGAIATGFDNLHDEWYGDNS